MERSQFPREFHTRNPSGTIAEDYGLYLTYENYLLQGKSSAASEANAEQSALSSLMGEAKREEMRHVKSKSMIGLNLAQDAAKADSTVSKIEELFLASKMKSEELTSLRKLSSYLDAQKVLLMHKLSQLRSKSHTRVPACHLVEAPEI